ncbi:seminal metalloprotease 1 [Aphomia sociella]
MVMNALEEASCVRFNPLLVNPTNGTNWIHITNPDKERDCVHEPRFQDHGEIMWVLGLDCLQRRDVLHSLMHVIGFKDEVTHPQRDQYVRVMWENIYPKYRLLFRIQTDDVSSKYFVEYDPMSIMHFHDRAYSYNGHATIAPLVPGLVINPSNELSQLDRMKLRLMFGHECNKRKVGDLMDSCKEALHNHTQDYDYDEENQEDISHSNKEKEINEADNFTSQEIKKEGSIEARSEQSTEENDMIDKASRDVDKEELIEKSGTFEESTKNYSLELNNPLMGRF